MQLKHSGVTLHGTYMFINALITNISYSDIVFVVEVG